MKRKWIMAAGLCMAVAAAGIGCGAKEQESQAVAVEEEKIPEEGVVQENGTSSTDGQSQGNEAVNIDGEPKGNGTADAGWQIENGESTENPGSGKERETLDGTVKSIGDHSVVLVKTTTIETEEGYSMAVAPVLGNETEADLVNVSFADGAKFETHVVKNGGVNPEEDVSVKEAAFSDVKENSSITLEGYYEGSSFIADKVVIYEYI